MLGRISSILRKIKMFPICLLLERSREKAVIEADILRFIQMSDDSRSSGTSAEMLEWVLFTEHAEEFRNLFYCRAGSATRGIDRVLLSLSRRLFKPHDSLSIDCPSIGPGLVIKHGFGTVIEAEKIGSGCLIFQDVVIGFKDEKMEGWPTLGNYVHIGAGAKVLGRITIGDHAVIAANAVVTRDLPPNSLAVGLPARILRNAGNRAEYVANGIIPA